MYSVILPRRCAKHPWHFSVPRHYQRDTPMKEEAETRSMASFLRLHTRAHSRGKGVPGPHNQDMTATLVQASLRIVLNCVVRCAVFAVGRTSQQKGNSISPSAMEWKNQPSSDREWSSNCKDESWVAVFPWPNQLHLRRPLLRHCRWLNTN